MRILFCINVNSYKMFVAEMTMNNFIMNFINLNIFHEQRKILLFCAMCVNSLHKSAWSNRISFYFGFCVYL